jgi:hypothetical protein
MVNNTIKIMVRTSFKGSHSWPEASSFAGPNVRFLEHEHRHTFHIKCSLEVFHEDRDVEFFVLQGMLNDEINYLYPPTAEQPLLRELGRRSCETIASELILGLRRHFHHSTIAMEVWEDNEVGAEVTSSFD